MVAGVPWWCINTTGQPRCATNAAAAGSCVNALTSLTMIAPPSSAAAITALLRVSIDTCTPGSSLAHSGARRASSSAVVTSAAPGRVDSAPISMIPAPAACMACAAAMAASASPPWPSLEKLSGVMFNMPITSGSGARWPNRASNGRGWVKRRRHSSGRSAASTMPALPDRVSTCARAKKKGPPASGNPSPSLNIGR